MLPCPLSLRERGLLSRREQIQRLSNQLHTDFGPDRIHLTWIVLRQAERHVAGNRHRPAGADLHVDQFGQGGNAAERAARARKDSSLLDAVRRDAASLQGDDRYARVECQPVKPPGSLLFCAVMMSLPLN